MLLKVFKRSVVLLCTVMCYVEGAGNSRNCRLRNVICRIEIVENYCGMTGKLWNAEFWYSNFNELLTIRL